MLQVNRLLRYSGGKLSPRYTAAPLWAWPPPASLCVGLPPTPVLRELVHAPPPQWRWSAQLVWYANTHGFTSSPYIRCMCDPGTTCHRWWITQLVMNSCPWSSQSRPNGFVVPLAYSSNAFRTGW